MYCKTTNFKRNLESFYENLVNFDFFFKNLSKSDAELKIVYQIPQNQEDLYKSEQNCHQKCSILHKINASPYFNKIYEEKTNFGDKYSLIEELYTVNF